MKNEYPPDRCYGCWEERGRHAGHEADIEDRRTGRRYCHEHAVSLLQWELDGCPEDPDFPYAEWITPEPDPQP